jgi:hypothetical protein
LNDLLEWISRNNEAAFCLGVFLLILTGIVTNFFVRMTRSITGNYPPASRLCDADNPCYCCREGMCDPACRCSPKEDSDDEDDAA